MNQESQPLGPSVELVVKRTLLLKEHVSAVLEIRERARRASEDMLGREMRFLVFDGFSRRRAEQAATNQLGLRRLELHLELEAALTRMEEDPRLKLLRLQEEAVRADRPSTLSSAPRFSSALELLQSRI